MTASTHRLKGPATPTWQRRRPLTPHRFGLYPFRSPLLRASLLLSSPRGTEMFQFPRFPLPVLCVQTGVTGHYPSLVYQFGHPRVNACLTTHRGLSQPATSFFGSERQGIHHKLLVALKILVNCNAIYMNFYELNLYPAKNHLNSILVIQSIYFKK